jgi:hypothetical protein
VEVLVEQQVADDGNGQAPGRVEDGGEALGGVLTVRVDCY